MCEENAARKFLPHLDYIKVTLCVGKKTKRGVVVLGLLDSRQLDVQAFYFRLMMSHNVKIMMWEPRDVNLVTQMRLKIQSFPLLVLKLNEYMKIVKIIMVQVLGSVEDEITLNNLSFMKSKLYNRPAPQNDPCAHVHPKFLQCH